MSKTQEIINNQTNELVETIETILENVRHVQVIAPNVYMIEMETAAYEIDGNTQIINLHEAANNDDGYTIRPVAIASSELLTKVKLYVDCALLEAMSNLRQEAKRLGATCQITID